MRCVEMVLVNFEKSQVLHRNIKASNVFLYSKSKFKNDNEFKPAEYRLADFGLISHNVKSKVLWDAPE